jgi:hypothetical protein
MRTRWNLRLAIGVPSVLALGLIAWGGYWITLRVREIDPARAALRAFLDTVREGRIEDAYRAAAPELRCRLPLDQFRSLAPYYAKMQLGSRADVSLRRPWPATPAADIDVSTHFDQDIPHHAALLKLDGAWRLAWIDRKPAETVEAADRRCGQRSTHIAMIREPLRHLVEGFERGDYSSLAGRFHASIPRSAAATEVAYARLKPKAAALKEALAAEPVFDADPAYAGRAVTLAATLHGRGARFAIRAALVLDGDWKLVWFDIDAVPGAH